MDEVEVMVQIATAKVNRAAQTMKDYVAHWQPTEMPPGWQPQSILRPVFRDVQAGTRRTS